MRTAHSPDSPRPRSGNETLIVQLVVYHTVSQVMSHLRSQQVNDVVFAKGEVEIDILPINPTDIGTQKQLTANHGSLGPQLVRAAGSLDYVEPLYRCMQELGVGAPILSMWRITWASLGSFLSQPLCSVSRVRATDVSSVRRHYISRSSSILAPHNILPLAEPHQPTVSGQGDMADKGPGTFHGAQ